MAASSTTVLPLPEENSESQPINARETTLNGPRRWEQPWSVQEIHAEAGKWSLAGDAGLLQHLQEFSQRMVSHTHHLGKEVDDLVHEAKLMDVRVNNVINDFIMLANTQFVENRVYDEDVTEMTESSSTKVEKKVDQEKTKEQREAELIPRVAFALKLGVDVIDMAFEKLDPRIVDSDSEEEESSYMAEAILEAKDPYAHRPLPFLIGTPQFMEDDNIGLLDELSDEEQDSDQGSISVSEEVEDDKDSDDSEYSTSEEESREDTRKRVTGRKQRARTTSSTASDLSKDDGGNDMFTETRSSSGDNSGDISASEEELEKGESQPVLAAGRPTDFTSELNSRLGVAPPKKAMSSLEGDEDKNGWKDMSVNQKSKDLLSSNKLQKDIGKGVKETDKENVKGKHSKHQDEGNDLFSQDVRTENDDLFGKDVGLFSSSRGLFDDEDDKAGLFEDVKKSIAKVGKSNAKDDSLFRNDMDFERTEEQDILGSRSKTKSDKLLTTGFLPAFGAGERKTSTSTPETSSTHTVKKPTAQPAGASNNSGGVTGVIAGGGGLFDDSEDENDLFIGASKKTGVKEMANTSKKSAVAPVVGKSDLFDDDEEDDLFGSMAASVIKKKPQGIVGLTVEGYNEGEKVEEKKVEDEQLRKKATPEKKLPPGAVSMFGKGPNPLVDALKKQQQQPPSSDEEENPGWTEEDRSSRSSSIHSTSSSSLPPALKVGDGAKNTSSSLSQVSSHLTDIRDDDYLFTSKLKSDSKSMFEADSNVSRNSSKLDHQRLQKTKSVKDSLFDSSGEDEDDIFSSAVKPLDSNRSRKTVSLFDDSDIGGKKTDKEEATSKDTSQAGKKRGSTLFDEEEPLFTNQPSQTGGNKLTTQTKETSNQSSSAPAKKSTPTSKPTSANLFSANDDDDDDDGDLFSVRPLIKTTPVTSTMKTVTSVTEPRVTVDATEEGMPEVKELKRPAGAVSMFGGIDPSAVLNKRKPTLSSNDEETKNGVKKDEEQMKKEEKKENTTNSSVIVQKPSAHLLFTGAEDDDDEDLFSPKAVVATVVKTETKKDLPDTPDKEMVAALKPGPPIAKKPAGAISMFGSIDPSVLLKKEQVLEPREEKKDEESNKQKPLRPQLAPKPKVVQKGNEGESLKPKPVTGAALFGSDSTGGSDLFGETKKKAVPPPTAPKSSATVLGSPSTATQVTKNENDYKSPDTAQQKTPAGAVSMYGGVDPFTGMTKTPIVSSEKDGDKETSSNTEKHKLPVKTPIALVQDLAPSTLEESQEKSNSVDFEQSIEKSNSVDFEDSIETEILASANKDRPKLNRRRPQSRKARVIAATSTGIGFENTEATTTTIPSLHSSTPSNGATPDVNHHIKEKVRSEPVSSSSNLFGNVDVLNQLAHPNEKSLGVEGALSSNQDVFTKDLFHGKANTLSNGAAEDLFADLNKSETRAPVAPKSIVSKLETGKSTATTQRDELDDLFLAPANKSKPDALSVAQDQNDLIFKSPVATGNKIKVDVTLDDNLFGSSMKTTVQSKLSAVTLDDDDLFRPSLKTSTVKSKLSSGTVNADNLFESSVKTSTGKSELSSETFDDDDLFGKTSTAKSKLSSRTVDDDNLFGKTSTANSKLLPETVVNDSLFGKTSTASSKLSSEIVDDNSLFATLKQAPVKVASTTESRTTDIFSDSNILSSSSLDRQKDSKTNLGGYDTTTAEQNDLVDGKKIDDVKNVKPKKNVTKESNLLNDMTDIFSDIPTSTPKERKKKTPKKVSEKSVFKGDIDDIFADTSAATIKPKKETKIIKTARSTPAKADNIFDDPLS